MGLFLDRYIFEFKRVNPKEVVFAFSLRFAGDMRIKDNLCSFIREVSSSTEKIVCAGQVHGRRVGLVKDRSRGLYSGYDALITQEKRVALAVFTADCLSVFLYDFKNKAVGLIHAGWRSSKEEIVYNTLELMQRAFGTQPPDLYVAFGPAIRKCCYKVKEEFRNYFPSKYIYERNNKLYFDLVGFNQDQLISWGIKKSQIFDCLLCNSCHNDILFSYRKEGKTSGRIVSVASII